MPLTTVLPAIAAALFLVTTLYLVKRPGSTGVSWQVPMALSAAFLAFSAWTIVAEGPTGFWPNHTTNLWGNQVWIDLLCAIAIGWVLILPRATAVDMNLRGWLVAIVLSGSVAFLAMLGRLLLLEARAGVGENARHPRTTP